MFKTLVAVFVIAAVAFCKPVDVTFKYSSPWVQEGIHTEQRPGDLGQINGHSCGPHSLMQSIYKITGIDMLEKTLCDWSGTTTGTSHEGLQEALTRFNKEKGYALTMTWYYFSEVTEEQIGNWMANPKTAIFFHMLYRDTWGHYELPYKIVEGLDTLIVANSLGTKCGEGYYGHMENRTWVDQKRYIKGISQKSVCVIENPK